MDSDVGKAYESLGIQDQIVVNAIIFHFHVKDVENHRLYRASMEQLKRSNDLELRLRNSESGD